MTNYREILRLDSIGLNKTEIAASCGCSRNTVASTLKRAVECGLSWPLPMDMSDQQLAGILYPSAAGKPEYRMPDYEYVYREMQRKGVTLNLLWLEYVEKCRLSGDVPYQSTQFNKYYGEYVAKHSATMHLNHKPGEIMQVDWAGDTAEVIDNITGEILDVYVFVAVLPYSGYGYVEGFFSMNQECWTAAHVNAFRYFGGVTRILQCDNLKTGVEKHSRNEVTLNKSYQELKVILLLQNYPRHLPGTAQAKSKIWTLPPRSITTPPSSLVGCVLLRTRPWWRAPWASSPPSSWQRCATGSSCR